MGSTPEPTPARFVVYLRHRGGSLADRRLVIERTTTLTTEEHASAYVTEILSHAWEIGTVLPIVESTNVMHVLDALDSLRTTAAPRSATIPAPACPSGVCCECHHEGLT